MTGPLTPEEQTAIARLREGRVPCDAPEYFRDGIAYPVCWKCDQSREKHDVKRICDACERLAQEIAKG